MTAGRQWPLGRCLAPVAIVVFGAAALAGCSGGGHDGTSQTASTAPASAPTSPGTPVSSASSASTAVLDQYRAFWAHVPVASMAPPAQRESILAPFATNPELDSLVQGMRKQDRQGEFIYGRNVPRPRKRGGPVSTAVRHRVVTRGPRRALLPPHANRMDGARRFETVCSTTATVGE